MPPRRLFSNATTTPAHEQETDAHRSKEQPDLSVFSDAILNGHCYETPFEKHLSKLTKDLDKKDVEIQHIQSQIDNVMIPGTKTDFTGSICCSRCHGQYFHKYMYFQWSNLKCTYSVFTISGGNFHSENE